MRALEPGQIPRPARAFGGAVTATGWRVLVLLAGAVAAVLLCEVALYRVLRSRIPQHPAHSPGLADTL